MREEVLKHQQVILKYLGRFGMVGPTEAQELENAYHEVKTIQDRCFHQFSREALFTSDGLVCDYCGVVKRVPDEDQELQRA